MNNLLTEISRIQEIIGLNKTIISEGTFGTILGKVLSDTAEKQIARTIRKEVLLALNNGVKSGNVYTKNVKQNIENQVLQSAKKAGITSLTDIQKAGLRAEAIRVAKEEAEKIAKKQAAAAKKQAAAAAKKQTAASTTQTINKNYNKIVNNITNTFPEVSRAAKAGNKTVKKAGGGTKTLKRPALTEKQLLELQDAIKKGVIEQIEQEGKKGTKTWANWIKWGKRIGIGAGVLWLLWYFMGNTAPEDMEETPNPKPNPNPNPNPNPGGNFKDCSGKDDFQTYGCKSPYIRRVQECIGGLVVDGIWGRKTNAKLQELGVSTGFKPEDVETICSKSLAIKDGNKPAPTPTPDAGTSDRGKEGAQDMGGDSQSQQDQGQQVSFDPNSMD